MVTQIVNGIEREMTAEEVADALVNIPTKAERMAAREAAKTERVKAALGRSRSVEKLLLKISFLQENRIRTLEGREALSAAQFRAWVDNQID